MHDTDFVKIFILFFFSWSAVSFIVGDSETVMDSIAKIVVPVILTVYFY